VKASAARGEQTRTARASTDRIILGQAAPRHTCTRAHTRGTRQLRWRGEGAMPATSRPRAQCDRAPLPSRCLGVATCLEYNRTESNTNPSAPRTRRNIMDDEAAEGFLTVGASRGGGAGGWRQSRVGLRRLHDELAALARQCTLGGDESARVEAVVAAVAGRAAELVPDMRAHLFGSQAVGLATPGFDALAANSLGGDGAASRETSCHAALDASRAAPRRCLAPLTILDACCTDCS